VSIDIRVAETEDAILIQQLAEAIWWPTYSPILAEEQIRYMLDHIYDLSSIRRQIDENLQTYLLLEEDKETKGFASYSPRTENNMVYKLHKLYVLPGKQGSGYGKKLLTAVEEIVRKEGIDVLDLNVNKYNPAKRFYEKMGYQVVYEEDIPIGPYWMNDFVMRKVLGKM
jgi:GNAT superfamily N-acetyltransferase